MQIKKSDYEKILKQVQTFVSEAQNKITRNKLEMAWKIGRVIDKSLPKNRSDEYGKNLIMQLERDTSISKQVLYKMRSFYQTYPKLPKDDPKLNWSHYRVLAGIKEKSERQALEDLTRENSWSSDELQKQKALFEKDGGSTTQKNETCGLGQRPSPAESSKPTSLKSPQCETGSLTPSQSSCQKNETCRLDQRPSPAKTHKKVTTDKIKPTRGKLATYRIIEVIGSDKKFFDCGFGIFLPQKNKTNLQKIADTGVYLNQLLLDRKLVEVF